MSFSFDCRGSWLTGSQASTCTFIVQTVSGSHVDTCNWSFSGSVLTNPLTASSVGSGVLELLAVDSSGFQLSLGQFSWAIAASASGTDTLAPTIPTRLTVTGATGALNCTIDPASDRYDGTTTPSGMDHYQVYLDGVANQTVAAAASPTLQFATTNIGNISSPGAPTASNAAGVWTQTAAGTGIDNTTAEQCVFSGAALAGDAFMVAKLDAFTSAFQYSTSGIMVRETTTQGAKFVAIYVQPSSPGNGIQVKQRLTTGGTSGNVASVASLTSCYVKLTRSGGNIVASYSTDGNAWTDIATISLSMNSSVQWGVFLSSQDAGVNCTSTLREVNLNTAPTVSFTISTTGAHAVSVSAIDKAGNASAQCASVSGTATAVATGHKKWNPGHGMGSATLVNPGTSIPQAVQNELNHMGAYPLAASFFRMQIAWSAIETAQDVYDFTLVDAVFKQLKAMTPARRLILVVQAGAFTQNHPGNSVGSGDTSILPGYLLTGSAYGAGGYRPAPALTFTAAPSGATSGTLNRSWQYPSGAQTVTFSDGSTRSVTFTTNSTAVNWTGALGTVTTKAQCAAFLVNAATFGWWGGDGNGSTYAACLHRSAVAARWTKLHQAIAAKYDTDPYFESMWVQENSFVIGASSANKCPDYSGAAWAANAQNRLTSMQAAFVNTVVSEQNSWLNDQTTTFNFADFMIGLGVLPSEADTVGMSYFTAHGPTLYSWGMAEYAGQGTAGKPDYRAQGVRCQMDVEGPDMGAYGYGTRFSNGTLSDLLTSLNTKYTASHAAWCYLESNSNAPSAMQWANLAPQLNLAANALTNTGYSSNLP